MLWTISVRHHEKSSLNKWDRQWDLEQLCVLYATIQQSVIRCGSRNYKMFAASTAFSTTSMSRDIVVESFKPLKCCSRSRSLISASSTKASTASCRLHISSRCTKGCFNQDYNKKDQKKLFRSAMNNDPHILSNACLRFRISRWYLSVTFFVAGLSL